MNSLKFSEYYYLNEALEFGNDEKGRAYFQFKNTDGISLVQIFKDIKDNRKELKRFIMQKIRSHHFSPLVIIISMILAGINTQLFINQNPEILNYGIDSSMINKAAEFLNKNPNILKIFQK
jgi:hypothetical protein